MGELADRFPRFAAYVASLPNGLDSFPECRAKASLLHYARKRVPVTFSTDALPERIRRHLRTSELVASWITEVEYTAITLALWDGAKLDDDRACESWYLLVKDLRTSILYRAVMSVISPGRMMRGAPLAWQQFHTGSTIQIYDESRSSAVMDLVAPTGLFPPIVLRAYGWVFQAAFEPSFVPIEQSVRPPEAQPGRTRYYLTY